MRRMGHRRARLLAMPLGTAMLAAFPAVGWAQEAVDEIVVTATLREQSLQEVPISVTALSSEELEATRSQDFTDLANITPNFSFDKLTGAGFVIPTLRGIGAAGSGDSSLTSSPAVAIYVDGVYSNAAGGNLFNVLDVERVEVLRGPQGTLYGRNALAGVINIVSRAPSETFESTARGGFGNYNSREAYLSMSGPLGEHVSGRAGLYYLSHDGYTDNAFNTPDPAFGENADDPDSAESISARGSLRFEFTSNVELTLSGDYSHDETTYPGFEVEDGADIIFGYAGESGAHTGAYNADNVETGERWGVSARWDVDLTPNSRLVSISGFRSADWGYDQADIDGTPFSIFSQFIHVQEESFSQELRYHFSGERHNGVVGVFYYDYSGLQDATADFFGEMRELGQPFDPLFDPLDSSPLDWSILRTVVQADTENFAVFGNFDWDFTERLGLSVGLRYSSSELSLRTLANQFEDGGQFYDATVPYDSIPDSVTIYELGLDPTAEADFSKVTPRAVLSYDFSDDTHGYLSWGQGYRDGGFSTRAPGDNTAFEPELLTAYEAGLKTELWDNRVRLNGAVYYYQYEDQQIDITTFDPTTGTATIEILNAASSNAMGAELEVAARLFEGFDLNAAIGYQQTEFEEFDVGADSREGNEFPRAPNWNVTISPQYEMPLGELGALTLRADWIYRSEEFTDDANNPALTADERTLLNLSATLRSMNDRLALTAWGRNVTDEDYVASAIDFTSLGYVLRYYGEPQTYGVTLSYSY